jgi:hypothetical protein
MAAVVGLGESEIAQSVLLAAFRRDLEIEAAQKTPLSPVKTATDADSSRSKARRVS